MQAIQDTVSGIATTAAGRASAMPTTNLLEQWQSNAYQLYIKAHKEKLTSLSHHLGNSAVSCIYP